MKALLAALLAAAGPVFAAPPASPPTDAQVEAAMAFARTYGVVRYFHPSDSLDRVDWNRFLVYGAGGSASLESLFAPIVDGFTVVPKGAPAAPIAGEGPLVEWRHLGYGMEKMPRFQPFVSWRTHHDPLHDGKVKGAYFQHQGLAEQVKADPPIVRIPVGADREALVPVSMPMSATKVSEAQDAKLKALAQAMAESAPGGESFTRAQAWADGIAAWNVARHFYPYWRVVHLDWEAELRQWLAAQPGTQTREQMREQLERLVAPLADGHGRIVDPTDKRPRQLLPIAIRPLGARWVVDASLVPERVRPGDVIAAVNGQAADKYFATLMAMQSGSPQFVRWRAAREFAVGLPDAKVALRLDRGGKAIDETLAFDRTKMVIAPRPEALSEVRPGIFYVDLSRYDQKAFDAALPKLVAARAIVFDMRGYPTQDALNVVAYWITGADRAQWMIVPRFDKPFGEYATGWSTGWQRERNAALEKPAKFLLTDGRAISFAESLVAYFPAQKTGRVIGERTGGVNGNVVAATLPSGLGYLFTGMRVTRHDGSDMHVEGFQPDDVVVPTLEGIRLGKDDVLERALFEATR